MKVIKDLALTALGLIVVLALLEGSLRLLNIRFSTVDTHTDPVIGYSLKPNAVGWETTETVNSYRINSDGMRDRDHFLSAPPNTLRIAFLGDSATEGIQVPLNQTYVSVFQRSLAQCLGGARNVETLNFAVVGYNLAQQYLTLREKVWKYKPQIVVVALNMETAVLSNSRKLDPLLTPPRMYFRYENGKLVSDTREGFKARPGREKLAGLIDQFELFKMVRAAKAQFFYSAFRWLGSRSAKDDKAPQAKSLDDLAFLPPSTPDAREAWNVTFGLLHEMDRECRAHNAQLHVVTLDTWQQTNPDLQFRNALIKKLGVPDLDEQDRRIDKWCKSNSVPCFHLAEPLRAIAEQKHIVLHGNTSGHRGQGHWTETGHRYAGVELARQYCRFFEDANNGRRFASAAHYLPAGVLSVAELPLPSQR